MKYFASALISVVTASEAEQHLMRLDHYLYNREAPVREEVDHDAYL